MTRKKESAVPQDKFDAKNQRPLAVRLLRDALLVVVSLVAVLTVYFMISGNFPNYFVPVDFAVYPDGPVPDVAPNIEHYGFYADSLLPQFEKLRSDGQKVLTLRIVNGASDYSGVSFTWNEDEVIGADGSVNVRWRGGRELYRVLVDLTVGGGPEDTLNHIGTNYFVYADSPSDNWTDTSIPLNEFKLNPYQPPGSNVTEPFDINRVKKISFTFWPGTKAKVQIQDVRFVWASAKWSSFVLISMLVLFGLLLWIRTTPERVTLKGKVDPGSSALIARLAYMLFAFALLLKVMSTTTGYFSKQSIVIYSLFFISILTDEFAGRYVSGRMLPPLKYALILIVGWYINFSFELAELIPLLAIAFLPIVLSRSKLLLYGLPILAFIVVLTHPSLDVRETLLPGGIIIGAMTFVAVFIREILAYNEAVEETDYARSLHNEVLENTSDAILLTDANGLIERVNKGFEVLTGCECSQVVGRKVSDFILSENSTAPPGFGTSSVVMRSRSYDGRLVTCAGMELSVIVREVSIVRNGEIVGFQVVATDITAHKQAEEVLRQLNLANETLIKTLPFGISIVDESGKILFMSDKLKDLLKRDGIGEMCWTMLRDTNIRCDDCPLSKGVAVGESQTVEDSEILGGRTFQISHTGLMYEGKRAVLQVFEDVTETRALQSQLAQSQKMESLGILASGVAHDFNNLLGIILGHAMFLEEKSGQSENLTKSIHAIVKAAQRGASLVRQMLTFARKTQMTFASVSINDSVREVEKLLEETLSKTITIECILSENLPPIRGDSSQMHQALLNLCVNARDAMAGRGTLTIETKVVNGESVMNVFHDATPAPYVALEVTDTGTGMSEETRKHIFEPFFTTKEKGKGTGLGLAVVFGIMENHSGFIDVESEPGRGTTMRLYFPISGSAPSVEDEPRSDRSVSGGKETVLVVEDEEMLLDLATDVLSINGYRVLTARDGSEAIEVFRKNKEDIALVISDLGLPKISGKDVLSEVRSIAPSVKFVIATGFVDPEEKSDIFKKGAADIIPKPYTPNSLAEKVREILDAN